MKRSQSSERLQLVFAILLSILILLALIGEAMHDKRLRNGAIGWLLVAMAGVIGLIFALAALLAPAAHGRDLGQWTTADQAIRHWYETLMQPDNPAISCCGEADAYWADSFEVSKGGEYVAIITDSRPDEPLRRPHIDVGTKFVIPNAKLKYDQSNPTGHGIVFLSRTGYVYCYVAPGGV